MREKLVPLVSAAVVVLLQIVVAPVIAIYSVVPSFIVAFVIVLSIVRPEDTTYVYAFVMGIISDLFTQVPFGSRRYCCSSSRSRSRVCSRCSTNRALPWCSSRVRYRFCSTR